MMTVHRLGAGDGYRYLTDQVANGDAAKASGGMGKDAATDYYTASGNPAGRWLGSGTEALGVEGEVKTSQMHNLYGLGLHPDTGVQLGRRYALFRSVAERVADRVEDAEKALGHPMAPAAKAVIEREELGKGERQAVAGFDLVFSPVKSVSLAWALTDDVEVAREVEAAHHAAVAHVVATIEADVAFARTGAGGVAQVNVEGVTVAAFDHRTSRAGDPDLHTHAVVSNKVRARIPGQGYRWLTLDSQSMYKAAVAMSERYNRTLEDELTRRLGWEFAPREDQNAAEPTAIREIAGVPLEVIKGFSRRRDQVENQYATLLASWSRENGGITPPRNVQYELAQKATLINRPPKEHAETVGEERERWRTEAASMLDEEGRRRLDGAIRPAEAQPLLTALQITDVQVNDLARATLEDVTARRSTWTVRHVQAAAQRATRGWAMASPEARSALVERVAAAVTTPRDGISDAVRLDPPELVPAPALLRRDGGESVFGKHASERYTTTRQLEAEDRLLAHAAWAGAPAVHFAQVAVAANAAAVGGPALQPDQLAAITRLATSGLQVGLLIGPAGTGKTTTVRGLVSAWRMGTGGRVHGLAPTAVAAKVLQAETGMTEADTIHRWQHVRDSTGDAQFRPGDLVVIDEAGMVGTHRLLEVIDTARGAGAKTVLVGDYRQLSAIESGGALRLLATDAPDTVAELNTVWRFADVAPDGSRVIRQWEADASLQMREGRAASLEPYFEHERIHGGAEAILADQLYEAWRADETAGLTSLMVATSNDTVAQLGRRARADLVAAGRVEADGVLLSDGNLAGVGDIVVTRKNNRLLTAGRDFVKNGDLWQVLARAEDGALEVAHVTHGGQVRLPVDYVGESVEQGYAMTVHRAQGSTVDTAYALVDNTWSRELLYVGMTRGRTANVAHVVTDHVLDTDLERPPDPDRLARAVLTDVLRREAGDVSATETLREAQDTAGSMATLLPRYRYAADLHLGSLPKDLLRQGLSAQHADRALTGAGWPALAERIALLAERGVAVDRELARTVEERGADGATDLAAVLHARLTPAVIASRPESGDWLPPAPAGEGELPSYLRALREEMDTRVRSLGATAAFEEPAWTAAMPPLPPGEVEERREGWELLAGRVAAYREAYAIDGLDALGALPAEPRQAEAHAHLTSALEQANRAADAHRQADAERVEERLWVARARLAQAEVDYWAAEHAAADAADAVSAEERRVTSAQRLVDRLARAEEAESAMTGAVAHEAATAGELTRARMEAAEGSRRERKDAALRAQLLAAELARASEVRDARIATHTDAQAGLPHPDARAAAKADAERTLANAGEVLRAAEAERAARAGQGAERRTEAAHAYTRAREDVLTLEARARALGVEVREPAIAGAPTADDDRRAPEAGSGREVER